MLRIDTPAANPREISSRSFKDNRTDDQLTAGNGRRQPDDTNKVWIVDGDLPTTRLIDRCDSPASHRSQTSTLSNSDNRTNTNLNNETTTLVEGDATTP
jgi:hypothetical protein